MQKNKISIILPTYNSEKCIDKCISSILMQTYKNFELIIIDDASKDNTLNKIIEYKKIDNRIKLITNDKNMGVSYSRNIGLKEAKGEYITFIDSDDTYFEYALETMIELIINKQTDAVKFSFNRIIGTNILEQIYNKDLLEKIFYKDKIDFLKSKFLKNEVQAYVWNMIIKAKIAKNVLFNENLGMMEDTIWFFDILGKIKNIYFSNAILYNYYYYKDSASNSINKAERNIQNIIEINKLYNSLFNGGLRVQAYTSLCNVIIENIFKFSTANIDKKKKINALKDILNNQEIDIILKKSEIKNIRIDRRILWKVLKDKNYKGIIIFCNIKFKLKTKKNTFNLLYLKVKRKINYIVCNILKKQIYKRYCKSTKIDFLRDGQVINEIINNNKSLARFGDGEFKWMFGVQHESFQDYDYDLSIKLRKILYKKNENLIIGIPRPLISLENYNNNAKKTWQLFVAMFSKKLKLIIPNDRMYADTNLTRFYMDYIDKSKCIQKINEIKKIWKEKKVVIIEGEKTKLGVNNDLFDECTEIKRIIAPNKNAFKFFYKILYYACLQDKDNIFLISLGPTATILSYELCKRGYKAIDIGHIDIEYEWLKRNAKDKIPINGKYVNEAKKLGDLSNVNIANSDYEKSILKRII